jgi:hypothetical protein
MKDIIVKDSIVNAFNAIWSFVAAIPFEGIIAAIPFKDVMVNAVGGLVGGALLLWLAVGWNGIKTIRAKLGRPSIEIKIGRTPHNIFTGIELGTAASWVQQQLGYPTKVSEGWWGYRFSDALVSLEFDSSMAVDTIAVALVDDKSTFHFPTIHFDCPALGKAMLSDVLADHLEMEHVESLRHSELLVYGREGPRGAWHYITLGALWPHFPGILFPSKFEWNKDEGRLITPKNMVKINWAALSRRSGPAHFPWDFGLKLQSIEND